MKNSIKNVFILKRILFLLVVGINLSFWHQFAHDLDLNDIDNSTIKILPQNVAVEGKYISEGQDENIFRSSASHDPEGNLPSLGLTAPSHKRGGPHPFRVMNFGNNQSVSLPKNISFDDEESINSLYNKLKNETRLENGVKLTLNQKAIFLIKE